MKTYLIIPTAKVSALVGRAGIIQKQAATLRRSIDGTKVVLKYSGNKPAVLVTYEAAFGAVTLLTETQALALMQTAAWNVDAAPWRLSLIKTSRLARHKWKIAAGMAAAAATAGALYHWLG